MRWPIVLYSSPCYFYPFFLLSLAQLNTPGHGLLFYASHSKRITIKDSEAVSGGASGRRSALSGRRSYGWDSRRALVFWSAPALWYNQDACADLQSSWLLTALCCVLSYHIQAHLALLYFKGPERTMMGRRCHCIVQMWVVVVVVVAAVLLPGGPASSHRGAAHFDCCGSPFSGAPPIGKGIAAQSGGAVLHGWWGWWGWGWAWASGAASWWKSGGELGGLLGTITSESQELMSKAEADCFA